MSEVSPPATASTPEATTPPRRNRRRRWLLVSAIVVAVVAGLGTVATKLVWDSVVLDEFLPVPETTTVYYRDGAVLAELTDMRRFVLPYEEIAPQVRDVTVAAEDTDFWSNSAGPITRALVRHGFDLRGEGTNTRVRTYVLASKLEDAMPKEEILAEYLNRITFGRATIGIEAAARAYFNKTAMTSAPAQQQLSLAEAMYLLTLVREPYPQDPQAAQERSRVRWEAIRDTLVDRGTLSSEEAVALAYPTPREEAGPAGPRGPASLVVAHILSELSRSPDSPLQGMSWQAIRDGGYQITSTIDPRAQSVLQAAADRAIAGSVLYGHPDDLAAAGVLVEPGTGAVLAYYGGPDGSGVDLAGAYRDEADELAGLGAHPPGGSFAVYTLAAALQAGYSLTSRWQWTPHPQPGRAPDDPVTNAGTCPDSPDGQTCSLLDSARAGLAVPLYDVTASVGPDRVLTLAGQVGLQSIWDPREPHSLAEGDADQLAGVFGPDVATGMYPVTVLDQAAAMATFAGAGLPVTAHFVRQVSKHGATIFQESLPSADGVRVLDPIQLADLTYALTRGSGRDDLAIQTGVWRLADTDANAHAWSIGFTKQLAGAIWIGSASADPTPIRDKDGMDIDGWGIPSELLRRALDEAQAAMGLVATPFPPPTFAGDPNPPGSRP